jgi:hypothetical protein
MLSFRGYGCGDKGFTWLRDPEAYGKDRWKLILRDCQRPN